MFTQTPHFHASILTVVFLKNEINIAMNRLWENTIIQSFMYLSIRITRNANMNVLVLGLKSM